MSELLEIILSAVDDASDVFKDIIDNANDMKGTLDDMGGDSEFEEMTSVLEEANAEVERLSDELAGIYMGDIEGDADAVEAALAAAEEEAQRLADALKEAEEESDGLEDSVEGIESLMAFQAVSDVVSQLGDAMWDAADRAGTVQDSLTRMGLAAEGAGIDTETMKNSVSSLAQETGRAGGTIRESFIAMTSAGITDMETMQTVFKGASAQAFILGTDVESLANKFSGMAMKSSVAERTLKGTGITVDELGDALGIHGATIDEINSKWETLSTDQRAAALGMAASMNEGEEANSAYKESWEGLQAQLDIAKGKLEVLVGKVFLPVLIPVMETAGKVLDWLGTVISGVMDGPLGGFISVVGSLAGGLVLALGAITAVTAGMGFFKASLGPAITASWELLAPWLPWIAIGAAIVFIIYEIGKAFGWWTDASSMIDAVWNGIQRLWDAFINHPDVQELIQGLTDVWYWLAPAVMGVVSAVAEFFGINESGNFDIVRALIEGIGRTWQVMTTPIRLVIQLVQGVINVFNAFTSGQLDLPGLVYNVLLTLVTWYVSIFTRIVTLVVQFGSQLISKAVNVATRFVSGIVNRVKQIPGKVYSILVSVVSRITGAIQRWISAASSKVSSLISKITSPFAGVAGKIGSALSGVANALLKPFKDAWNWIKPYYDKIKNALDTIGNALPFGGETAYGGETVDVTTGGSFNINTGEYIVSGDDKPLVIEDNINLVVDLKNVPSGVDTDSLINAITDKNVLNALVSNRDFQSLDARVKQKIELKNIRAGR